jgi:hypothetical protein
MVTRSSIDPIEEARARVRLRYMRGRAVKQPMAQIGLAAERLTRKVGGKKMPAIQMLKARWREIAGEQLYKFCRPERLSGGKDGRVLTLRVLPQAAPMVQHQSETIRQRVSVAAGGDVTAIKLVQGALTSAEAPKARRVVRQLTPKERAELEASTVGIEDKRLREAIVALGAAMLTADNPNKDNG